MTPFDEAWAAGRRHPVRPGGRHRAVEAAAWQLWADRPDREWTVVDCASFIVMQVRRLTDALTTDHHFGQAGFVRLLR